MSAQQRAQEVAGQRRWPLPPGTCTAPPWARTAPSLCGAAARTASSGWAGAGVGLPAPVRQVAAGFHHTGIVTEAGDLLMCGKGEYGRLGLGDEDDRATPTLVARALFDGEAVLMVDCGALRTAALTEGGGVCKVVQRFVRARHAVQVVVDVVPVALGVSPPPQREVGVLQEQRAVQHTLLVNLGPGSLATTSRSRTIPALLVLPHTSGNFKVNFTPLFSCFAYHTFFINS